MNHLKAITVKFLPWLILNYIILGIGFDFSFLTIFWITLVLGIVAYVVGDLLILPRTNNTIATIADFLLAYVLLYFLLDAAAEEPINLFMAALIPAVAGGIFEWFYHKYVETQIDDYDPGDRRRRYDYQTEFSEEFDPDDYDFR